MCAIIGHGELLRGPNGDVIQKRTKSVGSEQQTLVFDLSLEDLKQCETIAVNFYISDTDRCFVFFDLQELLL